MQRVGPFRVDFDRMVLVTFRYDDDKYSLYQGREPLRNLGIRVSDDLTKAQRTQLKSAKIVVLLAIFIKVNSLNAKIPRKIVQNLDNPLHAYSKEQHVE